MKPCDQEIPQERIVEQIPEVPATGEQIVPDGNLSIEEAFADTDFYRCLLASHHCGDQGQCQIFGQTFEGFSSPVTPMNAGKYACMVLSPFPRSSGHSPQGSMLPP